MWSIELWPFGGFIVRQLLPAQCERFLLFYVWKIITTRNARPYPLPRISPPLPVPPRNWRKSSPGNPKTSLITHQATGFGGDGGRKTRWPFSGLPTADKTRSYLHCRRRRMRSKHRSVLSAFRKLMLRARNGLGSRVVRCRTTVIGNDRAIKLVYFFSSVFRNLRRILIVRGGSASRLEPPSTGEDIERRRKERSKIRRKKGGQLRTRGKRERAMCTWTCLLDVQANPNQWERWKRKKN